MWVSGLGPGQERAEVVGRYVVNRCGLVAGQTEVNKLQDAGIN